MLSVAAPAFAHVSVGPAPWETVAAQAAGAPDVAAHAAAPATVRAADPVLPDPWLLLAALVPLALAIGRRRRVVTLLAIALLVVMAFEGGLHSVHHIADHGDDSCVIASASAHTGALAVEGVALARPVDVAAAVVPGLAPVVATRLSAPDRGRAPPAA